MKKILVFAVLILSCNVFAQTSNTVALPMDKNQQKKVKEIHKETEKQNDAILNHPYLSPDEKRARIEISRNDRDRKLSDFLTPEQSAAIRNQDPINWNKAMKQIDKQEKAQFKAEKEAKLKELRQQQRMLDSEKDKIKKQSNDLKRRKEEIKDQEKALKRQHKAIKKQ